MDKARLEQLQQQLQQKIHLANEQIRKAQEEYARELEIERNKDADNSL